jgi:hypothetical protein
MLYPQVHQQHVRQVHQASTLHCGGATDSIPLSFSPSQVESRMESVRHQLLFFIVVFVLNISIRYYIKAFYPGAAVKIQAFARSICNRGAIAVAEQHKLMRSQSVFALVIQRVVRGHFHRQSIAQFHASALVLQRTFRGHKSRYLSLGKERSQMETWVNMWMQLVRAGIDGEMASRDVEMQLNHVLVKPEPAIYFLGGSNDILFDPSFSQLYSHVKKQSVRALHHKIVSLADACLSSSSSVPVSRVEALASFT